MKLKLKENRGQLLLLAAILSMAAQAWAVYLENDPTTLTQPDGKSVACFIDGDEFFHRVHDAAGYTIIPDPASGWYVYAMRRGDELAPTPLVAGRDNPAGMGLEKGVLPAPSKLRELRKALPYMSNDGAKTPPTGTFNNLVVFIRFKDQTEFTNPLAHFDTLFNDTTVSQNTVRNYFHEASYNQLDINSAFIPDTGNTMVVSYQDTFNRSYYCPYNASTAPDGYTGGDNGSMRTAREHALLKNAVNALAAQVPSGLNIDADNDGYVDNVCFLVRGATTSWATLLWSHRWALYSQTANIYGKRVWDYNFEMETQFGVNVLCHEMGHSVGYPDLYHYYYGTSLSPCGIWDVMCSTPNPPTHTGAYMKYEYTGWISFLPEITTAGTYWLKPITSSTGNCYKIASPNSASEYFVVEYRRKTGTFENSVPGSGLLVYRINNTFSGQGNSDYDTLNNIFDEVYLYRPGGAPNLNGTVNSAYFSSASARTAINDGTDPSGFLHDGSLGGLDIYDIGAAGDSICFTVGFPAGVAGGPGPAALSRGLRIISCGPNPASSYVNIGFETNQRSGLTLEFYAINGQRAAKMELGNRDPGQHLIKWDFRDNRGKRLPAGVYIMRLSSGDQQATGRLVLVK